MNHQQQYLYNVKYTFLFCFVFVSISVDVRDLVVDFIIISSKWNRFKQKAENCFKEALCAVLYILQVKTTFPKSWKINIINVEFESLQNDL